MLAVLVIFQISRFRALALLLSLMLGSLSGPLWDCMEMSVKNEHLTRVPLQDMLNPVSRVASVCGCGAVEVDVAVVYFLTADSYESLMVISHCICSGKSHCMPLPTARRCIHVQGKKAEEATSVPLRLLSSPRLGCSAIKVHRAHSHKICSRNGGKDGARKQTSEGNALQSVSKSANTEDSASKRWRRLLRRS